MHYLILFGMVLAVGIIPAFGPPSWVFALFFYHKYHLAFWAVVLATAFATALGRVLLAILTARFKDRIPARYKRNLEYTKTLLQKRQSATKLVVGVFLLSPLPSAQLFEAAGLLNVRIFPLGLAFFAGRLVSLSLYLAFSHLVAVNFTNLWESGFSSWWAIVYEVLALLLLVAMLRMREIMKFISRRRRNI